MDYGDSILLSATFMRTGSSVYCDCDVLQLAIIDHCESVDSLYMYISVKYACCSGRFNCVNNSC